MLEKFIKNNLLVVYFMGDTLNRIEGNRKFQMEFYSASHFCFPS